MAKQKQTRTTRTTGSITGEEYLAIFGVTLVVSFVLYLIYRRVTRNSRRYNQIDPYVAKVDLHERYGGLEKRAVSIEDLDTDTLILLERDGKLNQATIEKLRKTGRLPDPDLKKKITMSVPSNSQSPSQPPTKRKGKKKK
jgi:hypothetical protein